MNGDGNDNILVGTANNDTLLGFRRQRYHLRAWAGEDVLQGGADHDIIYGGD